MYIRTTKRKNKDGSVVEYYQLAHNERHPETRVPTTKIIHNFGRSDQQDRDSLVRLCRSIAKICGLEVLDHSNKNVENHQKDSGLSDGIECIITVELGTVVVIEALWERLGIGSIIRKKVSIAGCTIPYERAVFAMVANRLCEPTSKLGVWCRWLTKVHLPSCQDLKLDHMYEAMDILKAHAEEIEKEVFFSVADLLNLEVDVVFYDTTTASFSIDEEDEDEEEDINGTENVRVEDSKAEPKKGLRKFGRPKEGGWSVQVVVALAVTREGLPIRSWVFPGNTSDVTTIEKVKSDLKGWKLGRALFVADAGMNSDENRHELAKACGKYLLATRLASVKELKEDVILRAGRYKTISENLQVKEAVVGDGVLQRRYIVCYNPVEAKRESSHRKQVVIELKEELGKHPDKTATNQWAIKLKASGRYGRYLRITEDKLIELNQDTIRNAAQMDGKWVIQTNDDTLSIEDAATGYKSLLIIERCFRSLKSTQIKMMPLHHRLPDRIEAHVKICVLALLIERVAELSCEQSWFRIREVLRTLQLSKYRGEKIQFFQRNLPSKSVSDIFEKLKIALPKRVCEISSPTEPAQTP